MNTAIILNHLPGYIKTYYPNFVNLIMLYYQWLSTKTECANNDKFLNNLEIFGKSEFLDLYLKDLGFGYNHKFNVSKQLLITLLKEFYLNKGNIKSFDFIFKILFNTEVSIEYPRDKMFSLSGANYSDESFMFIRVDSNTINSPELRQLKVDISTYESVILKGVISGATVQIESLDELTKNGKFYLKVRIDNTFKTPFNTFETINIQSINSVITGTLCNVSKLELKHCGLNFKVSDKLFFNTELSSESDITITAVQKGTISRFNVVQSGSGYVIGDKVSLTNYPDSGCLGTVSKISPTGGILGIKLWSGGYGYSELPMDVYPFRAVTIQSVGGSGAVISCESTDIGKILAWQITQPHFDFSLNTQVKNVRMNTVIDNFEVVDANVFTSPKTFKNRKGFLGENSVLTDSLYYQQYSYALKSNVSKFFYKDIVDELLHPIGYIRLDILQLTDLGIISNEIVDAEDAIIRGFGVAP